MIDVFVSSFRLFLSSRLICLSRQTHQQLFFFGWSSIKHITQTHINQPARSEHDEGEADDNVERNPRNFIGNENQLKIINYLARRTFFSGFSVAIAIVRQSKIFSFLPSSSTANTSEFLIFLSWCCCHSLTSRHSICYDSFMLLGHQSV